MTSPSQEVKLLTKEERETLAAVATETIAMELTPAFGEIIDAADVAEARWRLRYEATIRELESRVSPRAATAKSLDQIKEDIAFTISQHASNISEAVLGPLVDELAADFQKQPPSSAPEATATTASERGAPSFCGNCGVLTFANESHWPCNGFERENRQKFYAGEYLRLTARADFSPPQPAEPTGATDTTRLDWIEAEAKRLLKRDPLQLRTRIILTAEEVLNAGDVRRAIDARVASHPAEPETPSHLCPRCGEACVCAEGFDGDRCQHSRIGCKSAAPAEPERETTK